MPSDKSESKPPANTDESAQSALISEMLRAELTRPPEGVSSGADSAAPRTENKRKHTRDVQLDLFDEVSPLPDRPERRGDSAMATAGFPIWLGSALSTAVVLGLTLWFVRSYHRENVEQPLQVLRTSPPKVPEDLARSLADTSSLVTTNAAELVALRSRLNAMTQELASLRAGLAAQDTAPAESQPAPAVDVDGKVRTALEPLHQRLGTLESLVKESTAQIAKLAANSQTKSTAPPVSPRTSSDEVTDELVLLKERNRLTLLADEVMATGKSDAMRRLWTALRDPALNDLQHAAAAEIIRVQNHLDGITRLPPGYRIDVKKEFPQSSAAKDEQLETVDLAALLLNHDKPLPVRARAALLLGGRRTAEAGDALVKSLRDDPDLDVVKECQHALRKTFGMIVPLFDVQSAEAWWSANRTAALKPPATPATAPSEPAPAPGG